MSPGGREQSIADRLDETGGMLRIRDEVALATPEGLCARRAYPAQRPGSTEQDQVAFHPVAGGHVRCVRTVRPLLQLPCRAAIERRVDSLLRAPHCSVKSSPASRLCAARAPPAQEQPLNAVRFLRAAVQKRRAQRGRFGKNAVVEVLNSSSPGYSSGFRADEPKSSPGGALRPRDLQSTLTRSTRTPVVAKCRQRAKDGRRPPVGPSDRKAGE